MASSINEFAQKLFAAKQDNIPKPLLTKTFPEADEALAYKVQNAYVTLLHQVDRISGFKSALTNPVAQKMFNASGPASGVLFLSGEFSTGDKLNLNNFVTPVLETEIGFRVGRPLSISNGPLTRETLQGSIEAVLPMIEVADVGFAEQLSFATDLIAGNSASAGYIIGGGNILSNLDGLDSIVVKFFVNGVAAGEGRGSDAMGSQSDALLWLANKILNMGYEIPSGAYLMTGSLGKIYPGKYTSDFHADFGELGKVSFSFGRWPS